MADTSSLNTAQITAAAATEPPRTVVAARVQNMRFRDTSFRFYVADNAPGTRLEIRSVDFFEDVTLASISGAGAANAITTAERATLMSLLEKLFVGRVVP